ncbi:MULTISPECIES: efflux RND transporter permease subunit [Deefgea]|uniref:MMPL family transporter n=1 Tax=Deefgea chitinilytica TaxID=570276 RepID=A0ABS2C8M4_9NEIS|nr:MULTISPECIES: efflux RND transporter permease subunit [Deefgea]MBM5569980.1 MMPL family transporter [Deefgea chitinilytica]MBM9887209.1 efflux RND transporter permease subunit [Deefgea sp. CFH1-16]
MSHGISWWAIHRPVATLLLWIAVMVAGTIAWFHLPIAALPTYDTPTISVSANLSGASPETMANAVATPLEKQFSTIPGLAMMTSTSRLGNTNITLEFSPSRDIESAAVDVQAALYRANRSLPSDMKSPPSYRKVNPSDAPILMLSINSPSLSLSELNDYSDNLIGPALSTIDGVAQVTVYGQKRFAVRVSVDPDLLAARDLSLPELAAALKTANANSPVGQLEGERQTLMLQANEQLKNAAEFSRLVIANRNGLPVRLGDVATVEDSVENIKSGSWIDGQRSIILAILRQPGANTVATVDAINAMLPRLIAQMPESVEVKKLNDRSTSIRESIHDVTLTLILTMGLVVLSVMLFLRRAAATLIPSVSLPISMLATFALMYWLGYSLDNISLMGLTVALGLVVDDAIVVLENIVRHIEEGMKPWDAAIKGAGEVAFTVVSISISLIAVFIPIFFMPGTIGLLFHEFAVVVSLAVLVSMAVSLTLIPLFASRFLKPEPEAHTQAAWSRWFEAGFNRLLNGYQRSLAVALRHQRWMLLLTIATFAATAALYINAPKGFFPQEDIGQIQATVEAAPDISYPALLVLQQKVAKAVLENPNVATVASSLGSSGNGGRLFITLKPRSERKNMAKTLASLRQTTGKIAGVSVFYRPTQNLQIGGRSGKSSYQYTLQAVNSDDLEAWADKLKANLAAQPIFRDVTSDSEQKTLQAKINIDRDRASELGINMQNLRETLYAAYGEREVATIYAPQDSYSVLMQLKDSARSDENALAQLKVRSSSGNLVPLTSFASVERTAVTTAINHQGQLPAITLSFNLAEGASLSDAAREIKAAESAINLPGSIFGAFAGDAALYQQTQTSQLWLILIAVAVIYVVLGVLYESWIHPITILAGIPSAAIGALLALQITGLELTFIAMIGILLLVGIVKKNAIMMIDFALEAQRNQNVSALEAIRDASAKRFRPIMMTTLAALMGALPLALGLGAGAELRQPLGVSIVGGLIFSQLITLYITPVLFLTLEKLENRGISIKPIH